MPQRNQVAVTVHLHYLFLYNLVLQRLESIKSCLSPSLPATLCQIPWEISEQKWRPGILQALPHHSWRALWQRKCIRMNQEWHTGSNRRVEPEKWAGILNETAADWSNHSQGLWRNFQRSFRLNHPLRQRAQILVQGKKVGLVFGGVLVMSCCCCRKFGLELFPSLS